MRTALGLGTKQNAQAKLLAKKEYAEAHRDDTQSTTDNEHKDTCPYPCRTSYPRVRICLVALLGTDDVHAVSRDAALMAISEQHVSLLEQHEPQSLDIVPSFRAQVRHAPAASRRTGLLTIEEFLQPQRRTRAVQPAHSSSRHGSGSHTGGQWQGGRGGAEGRDRAQR
jgi:hypothetical protein